VVVAERTRVGVDDLGDPGVDAIAPRPRSARAGGIGQSLPQIRPIAIVAPPQPIVDRPAADAEGFGDLSGGLALVEPQERLGTAPLPGHGVVRGEEFQFRTLPGREDERGHRSTCEKAMGSDDSTPS
jgi:hypothetical protein